MAEGKRRFLVEILGDARGLSRATQEADQSTGELASRFGRVGDMFGGVFDRIGQRFQPMADRLNGGLKRFGVEAELSGDAVAAGMAGGVAAAGAAIGAFVVSGVNEFAKLGGEVLKFQRVVGGTAEDASRLVAVLDDFEVPADAGAQAFSRLARTIEASPDKLEKFGVEIQRTAQGTVDLQKTLLSISDAYRATEDPTKRAALGAAAFGRAYQGLIPILEQGGEALDESFASIRDGQVFSQEDLRAAEDYRLAMDRLNDAFGDLQREAGQTAIPAITRAVESLAGALEAIDDATSQEKQEGLKGFLQTLLEDFGTGGAGALADISAATREAAAEQEELQRSIEGIVDLNPQMVNALRAQAKAQNESEDAAGSLEDELREQEKAEREVARAIKDYETALRNRTNAVLSSISGQMAHRDAQQQVADAERELAKVEEDARRGRIKGVEAMAAHQDASDELVAAMLSQAEAAASLAEDQAIANGQTFTASDRAQALRLELGLLAQDLAPDSPLRRQLLGYIADLELVPRDVTTNLTTTTRNPDGSVRRTTVGVRAAGGPVLEGNTYLVGEKGPELVTPDSNAHVFPVGSVASATTGGTVVINATHGVTADEIVAKLQAYSRRNGWNWMR